MRSSFDDNAPHGDFGQSRILSFAATLVVILLWNDGRKITESNKELTIKVEPRVMQFLPLYFVTWATAASAANRFDTSQVPWHRPFGPPLQTRNGCHRSSFVIDYEPGSVIIADADLRSELDGVYVPHSFELNKSLYQETKNEVKYRITRDSLQS
eukprot:scaffold69929_cov41-Attheya_sp.AAC.5